MVNGVALIKVYMKKFLFANDVNGDDTIYN